jgi:hypothetical protein
MFWNIRLLDNERGAWGVGVGFGRLCCTVQRMESGRVETRG